MIPNPNSGSCTFIEIVIEQLGRYPEMQIVDLYKLAFQACMGNGHLISDPVRSLERLKAEIEQIPGDEDGELIEYIDPNGNLIRINLKPFKYLKKNPERLNAALIKTAEKFIPSPERLKSYWSQLEEANFDRFTKSALSGYFSDMEKQQFPARHHSEIYRWLYRPAYRVIDIQYLDSL